MIRDKTLDGTGLDDDPLRVAISIPDGGNPGQFLRQSNEGLEWANNYYVVLGRKDNLWIRQGPAIATGITIGAPEDNDLVHFNFDTNDYTGHLQGTLTGREWKDILTQGPREEGWVSQRHRRDLGGIQVGRDGNDRLLVSASRQNFVNPNYNVYASKFLPSADGMASVVSEWALGDNTDQIPESKLANAPQLNIIDFDGRIAPWAQRTSTDPIPEAKLVNAPGGGTGGGQSREQVDARIEAKVEDWAEVGNTEQIPIEKLANAPAGGGGGLNVAQVDARIADWAETANTDPIPEDKLVNAAARTDAEIDDRIQAGVADWAEAGNTDQIPEAKLANAVTRTDEEIDARVAAAVEDWAEVGNSEAIPLAKLENASAATTAEIDARIADWAETGSTAPIPRGKLTNAPVSTTEVDARIADWAETANNDPIPEAKLTNAPSAGGAGSHVLGRGSGILNVFSLAVSDRTVILDDDTLYRLAITFGTGTNTRRFSMWFTGGDLFTLDSPVGDLTGPGINRVPVASRFAEDFGGRTWQLAKSPEGNLAWAWPEAPNTGGVFGDTTATTILEQLSVSGSAGLNSRQVDARIKAGGLRLGRGGQHRPNPDHQDWRCLGQPHRRVGAGRVDRCHSCQSPDECSGDCSGDRRHIGRNGRGGRCAYGCQCGS